MNGGLESRRPRPTLGCSVIDDDDDDDDEDDDVDVYVASCSNEFDVNYCWRTIHMPVISHRPRLRDSIIFVLVVT
jgi:hypothetical protein